MGDIPVDLPAAWRALSPADQAAIGELAVALMTIWQLDSLLREGGVDDAIATEDFEEEYFHRLLVVLERLRPFFDDLIGIDEADDPAGDAA